jgi:trehalose/maltose hydrolase-like predicted phosphorylase
MSLADNDEASRTSDNSWLLHTESRLPWLRAYLGNGRLAVQLTAEGGLAGDQGEPLHLMAELYDRAQGAEVEHPVPLPSWSTLRLTVDSEPLNPEAASAYRQDLDLRRGQAQTHFRWVVGDTEIQVSTLQAVLRHEPNVALIRLTATATVPCTLHISAGLVPRREMAAYSEVEAGVAEMGVIWSAGSTIERGIPVAIAAALYSPDQVGQNAPNQATLDVELQPDAVQNVTWLVAVRRDANARDAAVADLRRAVTAGVERLLADHFAAWDTLWQADIQVKGDPEVQRFVRAGIFGLLCSIRADVPASIAPMGLSSMGYNGHIFWDADTWMFPPLLLLRPELARSMLAYRENRLAAARTRASEEGYAGAMFPWESATDGDDTTPLSIARTGLREHHITACVALAQWQYYLATGDKTWLANHGWPLLEASAQFWVSRVTHGERGYEIRDVIAADEYAENVDNDAFTNGAARAALLAATAAAKVLDREPPAAWRLVADGLVLGREGDLVLEYDGYDGRVIKQGDVELLTYPLEYPLSEASIACNLDTYRRVTDVDGPAMGRSISSVVAAQLGRREDAHMLFAGSYVPHLWGPFYSLAETRGNGQVNFLTGVAGALQALMFGFAGIRLHHDALAVDPLLPEGWRGLHFPALHWRRQVYSVSVLPDDHLEISPHGAAIPLTLVLQRWRPGPEPLLVEARVGEGVHCILVAMDWQVEPDEGACAWRLYPATSQLHKAFVLLQLTATDEGGSVTLEVEQRVRNGDT